jgi:hypothetical protein
VSLAERPAVSLAERPAVSLAERPAVSLAERAEAKAKLDGYLKALFDAAATGRCDEAARVGERAAGDAGLKAFAREAAALGAVGRALSAADARRRDALEALLNGQSRSIATKENTITGVVRKVHGGVLQVMVKGRVNDQEIEYAKRLKVSELTPACRARLFGEAAPTTPDEWVARALFCLREKDLAAAARALARAPGHPAGAYGRARLAASREEEARKAWEEAIAPLVRAEYAPREGKAVLAALDAFGKAHGGTDFAKGAAKKVARIRSAALGDEIRTAAPKKTRLELDFESRAQRGWCQDKTPGSTLKYDFAKGRESPTALRVKYRIKPIGRGTHWAWVASKEWFGKRDWSAYDGIAFWVKGTGGGHDLGLDLILGEKGARGTYNFSFADASSQWRRIEARWSDFGVKRAPARTKPLRLDASQVTSVALIISGGGGTILFDDVELVSWAGR